MSERAPHSGANQQKVAIVDVVAIAMNPAIDISATTETVQHTRKIRCHGVRREAGGGGINVARVLKRMGSHCQVLYPAGGSPGQLLDRLLDQAGIARDAIAVREDTHESLTVLEDSSGKQYRFVLPGPALEADEWQACLSQLEAIAARAAFILCGGSPI